jgi:NDP-sugar pyrophosphorylase family protein
MIHSLQPGLEPDVVAILAGGLATRLRPITTTIPKAMVEVAGKPFIDWQLTQLRAQGLNHVVLCLGFLGEQVEEFVGDGSRWGLQVGYSYDGEVLLGTGGALRRALPQLGDAFWILYGDSYLPVDYAAVAATWKRSGLPGLMTVYRNEGLYDTSNVIFEQDSIVLYDKKQQLPEMAHIDYGLGLLNSDILAAWPENHVFDLAEVYTAMVKQGQMAGHEVHQRFYEIGSHAGLAELSDLLLKTERDGDLIP